MPDESNDQHIVTGGTPQRWWKSVWYRIWPLGAGGLHKAVVIGVAVLLIAAIGAGVVFALVPHNAPTSPSSTAHKKTAEQQKTATESAKPDTAAGASQPNTPAPAGSSSKSGQGSTGSSGSGSNTSSGSTSSCALPKYPDASCTGVPAGTSLTVVNGNMTISTANAVIDAKDIRGCVEVTAPGVVIKRSKISADCFYVVYNHQTSGAPLTIEDSEIDCGNHNGTGIGDLNITVLRVNLHGCENGFDVDGNLTVKDSYIHDLTQTGVDPHTDGIQITPVGHDITIQHNTIYAFTNGVNGTSAIIEPDANITNIVIKENLFAGGAYTVYCRRTGNYGSTFQLVNNHFSTINGPNVGEYGPWTDCEDEMNVSGNVYHESGLPVPF